MPRGGLSAAALDVVRDRLAAGGRVVRVRPLRGGISSSVHVVHLRSSSGASEAVVVRRYGAYAQEHEPAAAEREFRVLTQLAEAGLPVPKPLFIDSDNGPFGAPTVVMSRLPGRPLLAPSRLSDCLRQMAETLVRLHAVPIASLAFLPDQQVYVARALRNELAPSGDTLQERVWEQARTLWPEIRERRKTLVHGDYWPGNILWNRGRLVGVVDWEQPRLGESTKDVATCRGDLSILFGLAAANEFRAHYEAAQGDVSDLRFWDLLVCTWALREIDEWATVYPLLGRPDLTVELARKRIRAFAKRALDGP
jgi:aminoglycoside phosphotransferase (APT) family kinase protein